MLDATIIENGNNQLELLPPRILLNKRKIKLIEMFGGIGSQAKAFEILSRYNEDVIFEHHKLIEFDRFCVDSYNAIHNTNFIPTDITKIFYDDLNIENDENVYLLTYSFPCQDLSVAGKGRGMEKGSGTRSSLLWEVERILNEGRNKRLPEILLMENVPQVKGNKNILSFNKWKRVLESMGYNNFVKILNAKDYGIPQNRERCFMLSILGSDYYRFPDKITQVISLNQLLEDFNNVPMKYILSEKTLRYFLKSSGGYDRRNMFARSFKKKTYLYTIITSTLNATDNYILRNEEIRKKMLYEKNNNKIVELLRGNIRQLTPKECINAMGFTNEDYSKISRFTSETQIYKQAGNSIVVPVLIAIFSNLYKSVDYEEIIKKYINNDIMKS